MAQQSPRQPDKAFLKGYTPLPSSVIESTTERIDASDLDPCPIVFGTCSTPKLSVRLRASSLDSSAYRAQRQSRMSRKSSSTSEWSRNETVYESIGSMSKSSDLNGSVEDNHGYVPDDEPSSPPPLTAPPTLTIPPPPLEPPPPLTPSPPATAPMPPLRWRSSSLDNRIVRSRIQLPSFKQFAPPKSKDQAVKRSKEELTDPLLAAKPREFSGTAEFSGTLEFSGTQTGFPCIAPPPSVADIRARSASLDYKIFRRGKNSEKQKVLFSIASYCLDKV